MNTQTDLLYRKDLLRLAADATGAGQLASPDATATAHNPACGDRVAVDLSLAAGRIVALAHRTQACVLAQASASVLAMVAVGLNGDGLAALAADVRVMLNGDGALPAYAAFEGAADHAGRHRCVMLPIEAALDALKLSEPGAEGA